jgi:hypothetical protein
MNRRHVIGLMAIIAVGLIGSAGGVSLGQDKKNRIYELRTYTVLPGRLPALHQRFTETMKLFEKHGMKNEMYWVPTDEARKDNTLIYLLSHESRGAADRSWKAFSSDPEWIKLRDTSEVDGKILAKSPEREYMTLTEYSPSH